MFVDADAVKTSSGRMFELIEVRVVGVMDNRRIEEAGVYVNPCAVPLTVETLIERGVRHQMEPQCLHLGAWYYPGPMQYWINLIGVPYDHLFPIADEAERLGFTGLALADHLAVPTLIESPYPGGVRPWTETDDWPDVWVMIGAMAARTTRLRFVTNVYIVPMRHPLITAKAVATASVISDGRVVFGAGIGWMIEEFDSAAASFRTRGKRTNEIIRILRDAWDTGRVTADDTHYRFAEVNLRPQPASRIPIWIGGHSEAAVERAAKLGDGWISGAASLRVRPLIQPSPSLAARSTAASL